MVVRLKEISFTILHNYLKNVLKMNKDFLKKKLEEFIYEHQLNEYESKTLIDYRQAINIFIEFIPTDSFNLDKELLLKYKDYLKSKYATATYNKYVILINKFLKYLGYND